MKQVALDGADWDLGELYSSVVDPKIVRDKQDVRRRTGDFISKFKGNIDKLQPKQLKLAISSIERIYEKLYLYANYASYLHAGDTSSQQIGKFYQESNEFVSEISSRLLWFEIEIQQIPDKAFNDLISSIELKKFAHYLVQTRKLKPFKKSLKEEEIINKMSQTGAQAFVRLYDETSAAERFVLGGKQKNYAEVVSVLKNSHFRDERKSASDALTRTYKQKAKLYTYMLNTLILDKKISDEIRGFEYPQQSTFLSYEIDKVAVENLVKTVENNYQLSARYYQIKSKLLGYKLYEWDRYSLLSDKPSIKISWESAKKIIIESLENFDISFAQIAQKAFRENWISSKALPNKKGGAFCSYCVPSRHPYVMMSYTGTTEDVMTLAHELGHAIHAYLSRQNTLLNYYPSTATAEIASVFCESLVFDALFKKAAGNGEKIDLLASKIQGDIATIFRQVSFYLFELQVHTHRRQNGELSTKEINQYFQSTLQEMFGAGLTLTNRHKYWWMPVLHFYHYNFYVFTYAFGKALSLSLYKSYKNNEGEFIANYKKALSMGGSESPREITSKMGVNITEPGFWQEGIDLLGNYIDELESLL